MGMRLLLIGFVGSFILLVGCGKNVKVTGKVTFEDGTPLTMGRVCFQTETMFADGPLREDGTYTLGSLGENTGLPRGNYQVFITGATTPPSLGSGKGQLGAIQGSFMPGTPLVHAKFTDRMTSGLTCEVNGRTVYDIQVTPP